MHRTRLGLLCLVPLVCLRTQTLSPREIFYGEGRAAAAPTPAKPKTAVAKTAPPATITDRPQDSVASVSPPASQSPVAQLVSSHPLGLKYSVLKLGPDGNYSEVDPDSNFTAGDRIRVSVEVNDSGYLYVIAQGTSEKWQVLYPSPELDGGDNRVRKNMQYNIPKTSFLFDSQAGTEKLFVVLSRQKENDFDSLIYSLRGKKPHDGKSKEGQLSEPLMASNSIPIQDDLVQRLRQTYSRDLVIERVDDAKTPPSDGVKRIEAKQGAIIPPGEKAVYVVNPNAGDNAHVVADLKLRHQ